MVNAGTQYGQPRVERITNPFLFEVAREPPDFLADNVLMESPAAQQAWAANRTSTHHAFYPTLGIRTEPRFLEIAAPRQPCCSSAPSTT